MTEEIVVPTSKNMVIQYRYFVARMEEDGHKRLCDDTTQKQAQMEFELVKKDAKVAGSTDCFVLMRQRFLTGVPTDTPRVVDAWHFEPITPVFAGFSYGALRTAFKQVSNPDDWKAPIVDAKVPARHLAVTLAAIQFFCGVDSQVSLEDNGEFVMVNSIGYRAGPCGP